MKSIQLLVTALSMVLIFHHVDYTGDTVPLATHVVVEVIIATCNDMPTESNGYHKSESIECRMSELYLCDFFSDDDASRAIGYPVTCNRE